MFTPRNSVPFNNKLGIKDNTPLPPALTAVGDPIHKPLFFVFSRKGVCDEAFPAAAGNAISMFGSEIFANKGKYLTFNTPFVNLCNKNGNEMMLQRLETVDGKTANARGVIEVVATTVPIYERDPLTNEIIYGQNGQPIVEKEAPGHKLYHRIIPITELSGLFGNGKTFEGALTGTDGTKSTIYPLYDCVAPYYGDAANGFGWSIEVLTSKSSSPVDADYHVAVGSRVFQFKAYEKLEEGAKPTVWPTLAGGEGFKFALKEGAYYESMRLDLDYRELLPGAYRNAKPLPGMLPQYGIFKDFHFYTDNYVAIVELLQATERNTPLPEDPYLVDLFNGVDYMGQPYEAIVVNPSDSVDAVANYTADSIHYMVGGYDGVMNNDVYDELVRNEMASFGWGKVKYDNELKYSLGTMYDTGYSFDTKEKLVNFIVNQKGTYLFLSTHVYNQGQNDEQTEEAAKVAISAMLSIAPESVHYGTGSGARAVLCGQSFELLKTEFDYKEPVPLLYTICRLLSQYAGSKDPRFNPLKRFTRGEHTVITEGTNVNVTYKPMAVYSTDWDVGLIAARNYNYHSLFIPAMVTAYGNHASPQKGLLFSFAMAWLERVSNIVWAEVSGESTLTDGEYARLVETKITERIGDRLDVVAAVRPHVYFTEEDKRNGNTAHVDFIATGNSVKTQHTTTIVVSRASSEG